MAPRIVGPVFRALESTKRLSVFHCSVGKWGFRMSKSVTKADLVTAIHNETKLKKVDVERALSALTKAIQGALTNGQKVTLVGFGTFSVSERKAKTGINPQTLKPMPIPARKVVKFKAGQATSEAVNG